MNKDTKVIRKSDLKQSLARFGTIESIDGNKATVRWKSWGGQQNSTVQTASLVEVTPELEEEIRGKARERVAARQAKLDAERPYLCTNVNPLARVENDGHSAPFPLLISQTVNFEGKLCLYCKHPVVLRANVKNEA